MFLRKLSSKLLGTGSRRGYRLVGILKAARVLEVGATIDYLESVLVVDSQLGLRVLKTQVLVQSKLSVYLSVCIANSASILPSPGLF